MISPEPVPPEPERNLGPQPLAQILADRQLRPHDLVATNPAQLTHKLITRATKGRRLTPHSQKLVLTALQAATNHPYTIGDLFTYP